MKLDRSGQFIKQINEIVSSSTVRQCVKDIIRYEMVTFLETADYYLAGKSDPLTWIHYVLNTPVYTHFTKPLSRYSDLWVQRQISDLVDMRNGKHIHPYSIENLAKIVEACNEKRLAIMRVKNECTKVTFSQYRFVCVCT